MPKHSELPTVAGGGLLDRRVFLKQGISFSVAALASESLLASPESQRFPWMKKPGEVFSNYGQPSAYERQTIRWTMGNSMAPGNGVSWTPLHDLEGIITPNGLHFERHHNGVPQIDPKKHQLLIHGAVKNQLIFDMKALLRYPMTSCHVLSNAAVIVMQVGVIFLYKLRWVIFMVWHRLANGQEFL